MTQVFGWVKTAATFPAALKSTGEAEHRAFALPNWFQSNNLACVPDSTVYTILYNLSYMHTGGSHRLGAADYLWWSLLNTLWPVTVVNGNGSRTSCWEPQQESLVSAATICTGPNSPCECSPRHWGIKSLEFIIFKHFRILKTVPLYTPLLLTVQ